MEGLVAIVFEVQEAMADYDADMFVVFGCRVGFFSCVCLFTSGGVGAICRSVAARTAELVCGQMHDCMPQ